MLEQMPYIYVTDRQLIKEDVWSDEGIVGQESVGGAHAIWAARAPFVPNLISGEFTHLSAGERIARIATRQIRFLYDLTNLTDAEKREGRPTFELRFIATPSVVPGQPGRITIAFLGKIFYKKQRVAHDLAKGLWQQFHSNYPSEDPFNYPLQPAVTEDEFQALYAPIPFTSFKKHECIAEIRKFEEMPINVGRIEISPRLGEYIVHPFVPALDHVAIGNLFEMLAAQQTLPRHTISQDVWSGEPCCFASVSIRPTCLQKAEIAYINAACGHFRKLMSGETKARSEHELGRAPMGTGIYEALMREYQHLFLIKVQVVGVPTAPRPVITALGSALMNNAASKYPARWELVHPSSDEELQIAYDNLLWLEHQRWGDTVSAPISRRIRYLVAPLEAYGAFRLPIPPESGFLAGVVVRNEPFVAPSDYLEKPQKSTQAEILQTNPNSVSLGEIYHRGNATGRHFSIPVEQLTRHGLFAGSTGSGKTNSMLCVLAQLWRDHGIPFFVIYPLNKPDYRKLLATEAIGSDLLVFTLGDDNVSPFRFNPFAIPERVLVRTHLSRLLRSFTAAYAMEDPLPSIYREALRRVYLENDWDVVSGRGGDDAKTPTMASFYDAIVRVTEELEYGRDVQANVRQASEIRIRDLLENTGSVINVEDSGPIAEVLECPTVIELGRVGSMEDIALMMGFLVLIVSEHIEQQKREKPHIMVVEEAHRLMSKGRFSGEYRGDPRSRSGEDFSNILAEVRGFNEGILIAEQTPTNLVSGAIGNTYLKIMHWLEDAQSFALFSDLMNLDDRQREYARTLKPGEAIVRSEFGKPVHIVAPKFEEEFIPQKLRQKVDFLASLMTDDCLIDLIPKRLSKLKIEIPEASKWTRPNRQKQTPLPLPTCTYCRPFQASMACPYQGQVTEILLDKALEPKLTRQIKFVLMADNRKKRWQGLNTLFARVQQTVGYSQGTTARGLSYCYLAHMVNLPELHQWQSLLEQFVDEYCPVARR